MNTQWMIRREYLRAQAESIGLSYPAAWSLALEQVTREIIQDWKENNKAEGLHPPQ